MSVQCDLCGRTVEDFVQNSNDTVCKSCEKLSQGLDDLLIDRSDKTKTVKAAPKWTDHSNNHLNMERSFARSNTFNGESTKTLVNTKPNTQILRESVMPDNKNHSHQTIDELLFKLRQSSLHRNPKVNVHNIPYAQTRNWKNDSLISSDESFVAPRDGFCEVRIPPQ